MNKTSTLSELLRTDLIPDDLIPPPPEGYEDMTPAEKKKASDKAVDEIMAKLTPEQKSLIRIMELLGLAAEPTHDKNGKPYPICDGCGKRHKPDFMDTLMEGMALSIDPADLSGDEKLNSLVTDYQKRGGPRIHWHTQTGAGMYDMRDDIVSVPKPLEAELEPESGMTAEEQHRRTVCHECSHSTGFKTRLNRKGMKRGIDDGRGLAYEEMVADRAAQMILTATGMMTPALKKSTENYLKHFAKGFEKNEGMTYGEARQMVEKDAKAAAELVLGKKLERKRKPRKEKFVVSPAEESRVYAEAK